MSDVAHGPLVIDFHPLSFIFIHFNSCPSTSIHFIHFHSLSFISIKLHSFYPLSFIFYLPTISADYMYINSIHFHPFPFIPHHYYHFHTRAECIREDLKIVRIFCQKWISAKCEIIFFGLFRNGSSK